MISDDVIGGFDQSVFCKYGEGLVLCLLVISVVVIDMNGYFEVFFEGLGVSVDFGKILMDIVIFFNCVRIDLLCVVREEVVSGMESLVGRVEGIGIVLLDVVCVQLSVVYIDKWKGVDVIKKVVLDYVVQFLIFLYKIRKLKKEDFKFIVKKLIVKVGSVLVCNIGIGCWLNWQLCIIQ